MSNDILEKDFPSEQDENATRSLQALNITGEATERREASVKHFRNGDGTYVAVDYGYPVHYRESS
ncbi:MAG: hypothetical protein FWG40_10440, partial [Peptococcaceae bacterium]|nr:hypothetical protein [Peptococcaceae bacterium]